MPRLGGADARMRGRGRGTLSAEKIQVKQTHPHITHHFPVVGVVRLLNQRKALTTQTPLNLNQLGELKTGSISVMERFFQRYYIICDDHGNSRRLFTISYQFFLCVKTYKFVYIMLQETTPNSRRENDVSSGKLTNLPPRVYP